MPWCPLPFLQDAWQYTLAPLASYFAKALARQAEVGDACLTAPARCHGNYHLRQALCTGKDVVLIDFKGEPARLLWERQLKHCPLLNVTGMLCSFISSSNSSISPSSCSSAFGNISFSSSTSRVKRLCSRPWHRRYTLPVSHAVPDKRKIDFPGYSGEQSLEHISWEEWFEKFDEKELALVVENQLSEGDKSRFNKLVSRHNTKLS